MATIESLIDETRVSFADTQRMLQSGIALADNIVKDGIETLFLYAKKVLPLNARAEALNAVLRKNPQHKETRLWLWITYISLRRYDDAAAVIKESVVDSIAPDGTELLDPRSYSAWKYALYKGGKYDEVTDDSIDNRGHRRLFVFRDKRWGSVSELDYILKTLARFKQGKSTMFGAYLAKFNLRRWQPHKNDWMSRDVKTELDDIVRADFKEKLKYAAVGFASLAAIGLTIGLTVSSPEIAAPMTQEQLAGLLETESEANRRDARETLVPMVLPSPSNEAKSAYSPTRPKKSTFTTYKPTYNFTGVPRSLTFDNGVSVTATAHEIIQIDNACLAKKSSEEYGALRKNLEDTLRGLANSLFEEWSHDKKRRVGMASMTYFIYNIGSTGRTVSRISVLGQSDVVLNEEQIYGAVPGFITNAITEACPGKYNLKLTFSAPEGAKDGARPQSNTYKK